MVPFKMTVAGHSDVGQKREKNEDSFTIEEAMGFAMVADGMGGHSGGECASKMAVETVVQVMRQFFKDPDVTLSGGKIKAGDYGAQLNYAVREAGRKIFEKASQDADLKGMGTTTVLFLRVGDKVYVSNVGDSRAYLLRNASLKQVTQDHSFVGEQLRAGIISADVARTHRMRNVITRSVGFQADVESDVIVKPIKAGDHYLLCSDGLSNMVSDAEIEAILLNHDPQAAAKRLVDIANVHGGEDNITAVVVAFEREEKDPSETSDEDEPTIEL